MQGALPRQHGRLCHFPGILPGMASDGLHGNLELIQCQQDAVSILILKNCSSDESGAWAKIMWILIGRGFYHSYLVGITLPDEGP